MLITQSLAAIGRQMLLLAVIWLLSGLTRSPKVLTVLLVVMELPYLALMMPAGVWADRGPRRRLALGFTAAQAVIALGLAWFLATRHLAWPILAVFMVAEEAAMAVMGPALGAWTITLVEPDQLAVWNGWNQTTLQVASLVGPSLGGILLAARGVPDTVAWSAVGLALGGLGIVAAGSNVRQEKSRPSPMQGAWRDGWRFIRAQPGMLPMMLFFAVTNGLNNVEAVLVPILARLVLRVPAWQFGLLPTAFGTGAVLGSWAGVHLDRNRRRTRWMLAAMALFGLAIVGMGMAPSVWWLGGAYVTAGAGFATAEVSSSTLWQRLIPDALRGRVLSTLSTVARTANPLGFILAGVLGSVLGIRGGLLAGGGAILVAAVAVASSGIAAPLDRPSPVKTQDVGGGR